MSGLQREIWEISPTCINRFMLYVDRFMLNVGRECSAREPLIRFAAQSRARCTV